MGTGEARGKRPVAADIWRLMAGFTTANFQAGDRLAPLRELGLTPGHMKALAVLDPQEPKPMRALADALSCDASMVTMIVDRLEERGLVERRVLLDDRRVKTLVLTRRGIQTRARLAEAMSEPPEALLGLNMVRLEALRKALSELPPPGEPFWSQSNLPPPRVETSHLKPGRRSTTQSREPLSAHADLAPDEGDRALRSS